MATMSSDWNADAYDKLSAPQQRWGEEILERLALCGTETLLDIGCGTGRLTERILPRLPRGRVVAIDRSPGMLQVARTNLRPRFPGRVWFVRADGAALPLRSVADVAFSTATFHWILDHSRLVESVFAALKPGGRLVAQCGGGPNLARLIGRASMLAARPEFARFFEGWRDPWRFEDAPSTARRLEAAGFIDVETSTHPAPVTFSSAAEFEDFLACVCVRSYLTRLPATEHETYLHSLSASAATDDPPFTLDYWRLNLSARKPG
jgi:trans-aconitate 2-methyltransferase